MGETDFSQQFSGFTNHGQQLTETLCKKRGERTYSKPEIFEELVNGKLKYENMIYNTDITHWRGNVLSYRINHHYYWNTERKSVGYKDIFVYKE